MLRHDCLTAATLRIGDRAGMARLTAADLKQLAADAGDAADARYLAADGPGGKALQAAAYLWSAVYMERTGALRRVVQDVRTCARRAAQVARRGGDTEARLLADAVLEALRRCLRR